MASNFYAAPTYASSGGAPFPVYAGGRRQVGGSVLGSLRQLLAPVGSAAMRGLKTVASNKTLQNMGKTIATEAAKKGAQVLTNVAVDALQGKNAQESLKEHSTAAALEVLTNTAASSKDEDIRSRKVAKRRLLASSSSSSNSSSSNKLKQNPKKRVAETVVEELAPEATSAKRRRRAEYAKGDLF